MYTCREHGCTSLFKNKKGLSSHFKDEHNISYVDEGELDLILELSYRPAYHLPPHKSCFFCDNRSSYSEGSLRQHIAYHLEDIALGMLCENDGFKSESAGPSSAMRQPLKASQFEPGKKDHKNHDEFNKVRARSSHDDEGGATFGSIHLGHRIHVTESNSSLSSRLFPFSQNPWIKGKSVATPPTWSSGYNGVGYNRTRYKPRHRNLATPRQLEEDEQGGPSHTSADGQKHKSSDE